MDFVKNLFNRFVNEPAVILGVVVAAVNATTVQTWQGYASAVGVALLRFIVTPVIGKTANPVPARSAGFDKPDIKLPS